MIAAPSDLDRPVCAPKIAGTPVRFFEGDSEDGLPWTHLPDLMSAANLAKARREQVRQYVLDAPHSDAGFNAEETKWVTPKRVVTEDGSEIVIGQVAVCGLLGSLIKQGAIPQQFANEYRSAVESALDALCGGSPPPVLVARLRTVALVMYDFNEKRPS